MAAAAVHKANAVIEGRRDVEQCLEALPWLQQSYAFPCLRARNRDLFLRRGSPERILLLQDFGSYYEQRMETIDDLCFPLGTVLLIRDPKHQQQCHVCYITRSIWDEDSRKHHYKGFTAHKCTHFDFSVGVAFDGGEDAFTVVSLQSSVSDTFYGTLEDPFILVLWPADEDVLTPEQGWDLKENAEQSTGHAPGFLCPRDFWEQLEREVREGAARGDRRRAR